MIKNTLKFGRIVQCYAIQLKQIRKIRPSGINNTQSKTITTELPQFDIQLTYQKSNWINLINNIVENKYTYNENLTIIQQFSDNGNQLFTTPDQDIRLFNNMIQLSRENKVSLKLEDKRWFLTSMNSNHRLIPLFLTYLQSQPAQAVIELVENVGLCNPDTQVQILYQIDSIFQQSDIRSIIQQNLPDIVTVKRIQSIHRLKILYKKSGKLQLNALKFLEQTITLLTNNKYGDWIMEDRKLLSLANELSGYIPRIDNQNFQQLLKFLSQKVVKLNSPQHNKFLMEFLAILKQKKLIDNTDFLLLDNKDITLQIELSNLMDKESFKTFLKGITFTQFYQFLSNKSSEERHYFLGQFDSQQLLIIDEVFSLQSQLISLTPSLIYLQLVAQFMDDPSSELENVQLILKSLKHIDPFVFYSLFQISIKTKNPAYLQLIKVDDLVLKYKQIVYVLNKICDSHPTQLENSKIIKDIMNLVVTQIHQGDQEDLQRVLYTLQKINLSHQEFSEISPFMMKALKEKIPEIKSQNKLVSMLHCLSSLKRQYQFEDTNIFSLFDQKISTILAELSSKNIFLVHKTIQFTKGLPILESQLKNHIDQKGKLNEYLPGKINYTAAQIKLSSSYQPHKQLVKNIIDQLLLLKEDQINLELLSELSNLLLKVEKHGQLDQELVNIHQKFMKVIGSRDFTHHSHILQATLIYQDNSTQILGDVDLQTIQAFQLITLFQYLVQAKLFDNPYYQPMKDQIMQRTDFFNDSSTKDMVDKGLLSLTFFIASIDRDTILLQCLCQKYANEFHGLIQEIKSINVLLIKPKRYYVDMYDHISSMNALQLYEGAIFASQIHGLKNNIIDQLLDLKELVVILNKKKSKTSIEGSSFEVEVQQLLQKVISPLQIMKEYDVIEPFQIDFYIPDKKIGIECDGHQHMIRGQLRRSNELRNQVIERHGIRIKSIFIDQWRKKTVMEKLSYLEVQCV